MEGTGRMTDQASRLQRKLKIAAYLLIAGLVVEGVSLYWSHPTSFLVFIIVGGILLVAGIVTYLIAIVTH
jgi:predicted membrane channel-forming protein YqfA (hemolysin III family)